MSGTSALSAVLPTRKICWSRLNLALPAGVAVTVQSSGRPWSPAISKSGLRQQIGADPVHSGGQAGAAHSASASAATANASRPRRTNQSRMTKMTRASVRARIGRLLGIDIRLRQGVHVHGIASATADFRLRRVTVVYHSNTTIFQNSTLGTVTATLPPLGIAQIELHDLDFVQAGQLDRLAHQQVGGRRLLAVRRRAGHGNVAHRRIDLRAGILHDLGRLGRIDEVDLQALATVARAGPEAHVRHQSGAADCDLDLALQLGDPVAVRVVQVLAETGRERAQVADRLAGVVVPATVVPAAADDAEDGRVDEVDRDTPCSRG